MQIKVDEEIFEEVNVLLDTYENFINSSEYENQAKSFKDAYKKVVEDKVKHYTWVHKSIFYIQRESDGKNIGMRSAELGLEEVVIDILERSEEAACQTDFQGRNMGMYAAKNNLRTATLLALKIPKCRIQRDNYGKNIEDYQYSYFNEEEWSLKRELKEPYNEIVKQIRELNPDNFKGTAKRRALLEQKIINKIKEDERVLLYQNEYDENIGMFAAYAKLENLVLYTLENGEASVQQNNNGLNIGMCSAINGLRNATLKSLDNPVASMQQSEYGNNIGMFAGENDMEEAVIKALDNPIASIQVNFYYENLGIISAKRGLKTATKKALENEQACAQETSRGQTIYSYAKNLFNDEELNIEFENISEMEN